MPREDPTGADPGVHGRADHTTTVGAVVAAALGLLLLAETWRRAFEYRDWSGEGKALLLAVVATGLVIVSSLPLAVVMANASSRPLLRWVASALVVFASAATSAWMSAATHG